MNNLVNAPEALLLSMLLSLTIGIVLIAWGKKIPQSGVWLGWFALIALLTGLISSGQVFVEEGWKPRQWLRGWIWPHDQVGAITIGILEDAMGLCMATLFVLVSMVLLANRSILQKEARPDRFYSALVISVSGALLSWLSGTPWTAFIGLALCVFGGFVCMGSRWTLEKEARIASRYGAERAWGLGLAILGACGLAVSRSALVWENDTIWLIPATVSLVDQAGTGFLVLGLMIQLQPFPLSGWVISPSEVPVPWRILLAQVFPAGAAFAVLIRLDPELRAIGVYPGLGWVHLGSVVFAVASGVTQASWRLGLGAWISSGFSLAAAALAFSGPWAALSLLIGTSLAALALASSGLILELSGGTGVSGRKKALWAKATCFSAAAAGTGVLGFVPAGGWVHWLAQMWSDPTHVAALSLVLYLSTVLGWKLAWNIARSKHNPQTTWYSVLSALFCIVLSLGVIWNGAITAAPLSSDGGEQILPSLLDFFFRETRDKPSEEAVIGAFWVFNANVVLGVATAYWVARKREPLRSKTPAMQRITAFLSSSYGIDALLGRVIYEIGRIGAWTQELLDQRIWGKWIPQWMNQGIRYTASSATRIDRRFSWGLEKSVQHAVEVPAKMLQLIQSGDLQWYLFIAISAGLAVLVHFFLND